MSILYYRPISFVEDSKVASEEKASPSGGKENKPLNCISPSNPILHTGRGTLMKTG